MLFNFWGHLDVLHEEYQHILLDINVISDDDFYCVWKNKCANNKHLILLVFSNILMANVF